MAATWVVLSSITSLPSPAEVVGRMVGGPEGTVLLPLAASLRRMLFGFALVLLVGVPCGVVLAQVPLLNALLGPLIIGLQSIPGAAWVPLSIAAFGLTERAVVFTILLGAAGILTINTSSGIRETPPLLLRASRTLGAEGWRAFRYVVLPAAVPRVITGMRLAWAFGWRALMAGELMVRVPGLGERLNSATQARDAASMAALMLVIAMTGFGVDGLIFQTLERSTRQRWGLETR